MAGVKGRSGRKSKSQEEKRLEVINKAWNIVNELFDNPQADFYYKLQYAIDVVKRSIPQTPLIDQSQHTHFTVTVRKDDGKENRIPPSFKTNGSLGR